MLSLLGRKSASRSFLYRTIVVVLLVFAGIYPAENVARASAICPNANHEFLKDSLACHLEIISWVEVNFQGKLLENHKAEYEKLIRLRLRNDLSMVKHEALGFFEAFKKFEFNFNSQKMKKRGKVGCHIWTVGDDFPVARHIECELSGYGRYGGKSEFSQSNLGYSNAADANDSTRSALRGIIAEISANFLEARDRANSKELQ